MYNSVLLPMVKSTSPSTKLLSHFLYFSDFLENYCMMDLAFVVLMFFFFLHNAPKLGNSLRFTQHNQRSTDQPGHGEVDGYHGEQNWDENLNQWGTRIPMMCSFLLSEEMSSWTLAEMVYKYPKTRVSDKRRILCQKSRKIRFSAGKKDI